MSIRGAERSEGIARRAEQAVQRCTAERRKPFGGDLAEGESRSDALGDNPLCGGASETARPYGGASIGINVKRSRGAKGSETDETSPTRKAVCGKTARTVR